MPIWGCLGQRSFVAGSEGRDRSGEMVVGGTDAGPPYSTLHGRLREVFERSLAVQFTAAHFRHSADLPCCHLN
jgi:hypothetical protein